MLARPDLLGPMACCHTHVNISRYIVSLVPYHVGTPTVQTMPSPAQREPESLSTAQCTTPSPSLVETRVSNTLLLPQMLCRLDAIHA
jgi:hypothetical protein